MTCAQRRGTAAGGGPGFALAGDIVIAAAEAKLVMAYTASGLTPDCGLIWLVPRRLSGPRAMDLATLAGNIASPDGIEGVDAFLAKRKPIYR